MSAKKKTAAPKRPVCETPGCGRPIPKGGEGVPEICPTCLACLKMHGEKAHAEPKTPAECFAACGIGPDVEAPETTTEWQVTPGDNGITHVFTSTGAVFGFLASEWRRFVLSSAQTRTCRLVLDVRRVEREKHGP